MNRLSERTCMPTSGAAFLERRRRNASVSPGSKFTSALTPEGNVEKATLNDSEFITVSEQEQSCGSRRHCFIDILLKLPLQKLPLQLYLPVQRAWAPSIPFPQEQSGLCSAGCSPNGDGSEAFSASKVGRAPLPVPFQLERRVRCLS